MMISPGSATAAPRVAARALRGVAVGVLWIVLGLASAASRGGAGETDRRSTELFRYRCEDDLGRREVTLFANGTIRLREGLRDRLEMRLGELGSEEIDSFLERLAARDATGLPGGPEPPAAVAGPWVERCEIVLDLPEKPAEVFRFGGFDVTPLRVGRMIGVADELAELTEPLTGPRPDLPAGYEPRSGDILRDPEGRRFRIVGYTADEKGLELDALDQPVRIFVALEELRSLFVAVESGWVP